MSEVAPRRLVLVDYSDKLEIALAQGHDPVCGTPAWMTAALDRRKPVLHLELMRGSGQVVNSDQDMVQLQATIIRGTKRRFPLMTR